MLCGPGQHSASSRTVEAYVTPEPRSPGSMAKRITAQQGLGMV